MVWLSGLFPSTTNGHRKSFQANRNVYSPSTAAPGATEGHTTWRTMPKIEQPSIRAASSSSSGTEPATTWRIQNTPKAVTSDGTITARSSPTQPKLPIRMNSGISPSCCGTSMVPSTKVNSPARPRKRIFANAKPARVLKNSTEMVMAEATTKEFTSADTKGTPSSASWAFSRKFGPGMTRGGNWLMTALLFEATTNIQ